jgi:hypothetical protein
MCLVRNFERFKDYADFVGVWSTPVAPKLERDCRHGAFGGVLGLREAVL